MRRGGPSVEIDVGKFRSAVENSEYRSTRALALDLKIDPAQLYRVVERGRCRADVLFVIEQALGLGQGELSVIGEEKNKPRYWRLRRGLSVQELSERSGVPHQTINRLERGGSDCRVFQAACLSRVLNVPMGVYLGYEG